jgi:putative glycosyltransferase (TIGR04372 family)
MQSELSIIKTMRSFAFVRAGRRMLGVFIKKTAILLFALLPGNLALFLVTTEFRLRGRKTLARFYGSYHAAKFLRYYEKHPDGGMVRQCPDLMLALLISANAPLQVAALIERLPFIHLSVEQITPQILSEHVRILFDQGRLLEAEEALKMLPAAKYDEGLWRWYADFLLIGDQNETIAKQILSAVKIAGRPHQSMAARDPQSPYARNELDYLAAEDGLLYDNYNYMGQRVTNMGRNGHLALGLYRRALEAQRRLFARLPLCPPELSPYLAQWGTDLSQVRLATPEWVTQIGHLGFLDVLLRMRTLGWWQGTPVILARPANIANRACLNLFNQSAHIAIAEETISTSAFDLLLSFQRYVGLNFNAFRLPDGQTVAWLEAAALAMSEWEHRALPLPMRQAYDTQVAASPAIADAFAAMRRAWGMAPDDWFVCLHLRDAGFYKETLDGDPRNTSFDNYRATIDHIVAQGGWVVRLGGPDAIPLPNLSGVIDYAHSPHKSEMMDLHLIRNSRYMVGTTSGLINIAIGLGIPAAAVNCISYDCQVWSSSVRFALRPVRDHSGRLLSQRELTSAPSRWAVASTDFLRGENSPEEILETVKEVEALVAGRVLPTDSTIEAWKSCLPVPHYYGAALPGRYFLEKCGREFITP